MSTVEPSPDAANAPASTLALEDHERVHVATLEAEGWGFREVRRMVLLVRLDDGKIAEIGRQAAELDEELVTKRQGKNARQAELNREKKAREGAITSRSERLLSGIDELKRPMSDGDRAEYSRAIAVLRREYNEFLVAKKEELDDLKEELQRLEEEQTRLLDIVEQGTGDWPVRVCDMQKYDGLGSVITIRLDTGEEVAHRHLADHERQLALFTSRIDLPPLDDYEYAKGVSGRTFEAARHWVERTGVKLDPAAAEKAIKRLLPNAEFPPEAPETRDDENGENGDGEVEDTGPFFDVVLVSFDQQTPLFDVLHGELGYSTADATARIRVGAVLVEGATQDAADALIAMLEKAGAVGQLREIEEVADPEPEASSSGEPTLFDSDETARAALEEGKRRLAEELPPEAGEAVVRRFDVVVTHVGQDRNGVVGAIRKLASVKAPEARQRLDDGAVLMDVEEGEAVGAAGTLRAAGAEVDLRLRTARQD